MNYRYLNYRNYHPVWRVLFPFLSMFCLIRNGVVFALQRQNILKELQTKKMPFNTFTVTLWLDIFKVETINGAEVNFPTFYIKYGMGSYHDMAEIFESFFKNKLSRNEKKVLCVELGVQEDHLYSCLRELYEYLWKLKLNREELAKITFTYGEKTKITMQIGKTPDQRKNKDDLFW